MIDIHTHILNGIDDGSNNIEESIKIIKKMSDLGYRHLIATPHYIENTDYNANNSSKKKLLSLIEKNIKKEKIPVKLYLGNEVFLSEKILKRLQTDDISSLNNSEYILIELPLNNLFVNTLDILYEIGNKGYKIILAHPERYTYFQKNPKLIDEYIKNGILLQGNIDSLSGKYGSSAKKIFKKLLKGNKYFTLASDIHYKTSDFFEKFEKNKNKIIKICGEENFNNLVFNNIKEILK